MRCPGCCNPELLKFGNGTLTPISVVRDRILASADSLEGVSFLGGEPFSQALPLAILAEQLRWVGLSFMVYTGNTLAEIQQRITQGDVGASRLLAATDLLVDGQYDRTQPDSTRRWVGSTNQQIHFLTNRYQPTDPVFRQSETIEIRLTKTSLLVNGWPWGKGAPWQAKEKTP